MSEIGSCAEVLSRDGKIEDCSHQGKCSNCGNCCNDIIPLTKGDIHRIKKYIQKNDVKPIYHGLCVSVKPVFDAMCPFRDDKEKKCIIYEVRPEICKRFSCHKYYETLFVKYHDIYIKTTNLSMRNTFFSEKNYEK